jgi:hypothetical protein
MASRRAILVLTVLVECSGAEEGTLVVIDRDGGSRGTTTPQSEAADASGAQIFGDASPSEDGSTTSGVGSLETPSLDLGRHIIGSESHARIIVRSDPLIVTRVRVVRIDGGGELSLTDAQIGELITIEPSNTAVIDLAFRPLSLGEKSFLVVIDLCEAGCYAETAVIADVPERRSTAPETNTETSRSVLAPPFRCTARTLSMTRSRS